MNCIESSTIYSRILLIIIVASFSGFYGLYAQPSQERMTKLMPETKVERLREMALDYEKEFLERKRVAEVRARQENWPLRKEMPDGTIYEITGFSGNMPEYTITYNHIAAQTTGTDLVYPGGGFGYNLTGKGMFIGEWDGGAVLLSHNELNGRVIQRDGAGSISNHATHVGGTLIGGGVNPDAKGMAYEAALWAHDWNSDNAEMALAASQGLLVSNHSYGSISGWANGDWGSETTAPHWWGDPEIDAEIDYKFGWYNRAAQTWDDISYNAPYYLIVKSAGNDRGNSGPSEHYVFQNGSWEFVNIPRPRDGGALGYDCIPTSGNAKNILTIGAVRGIPNGFSQSSDIVMSSFSGWGPTDDGRIKPDVVGNGVQVLSASSGGNSSYATLSGTSMSGPNVAGSLILLQQLHEEFYGRYMLSSTLKGIVIHTADSATGESRPDYRNGWGLVNIKNAADVLSQPFFHQFEEITINNGDSIRREIFSNGIDPVKITAVWTDLPGPEAGVVLNSRTPRLVNDLDVRLISVEDNSIVFFPFILDPENPQTPASTGDNNVDNVEVIYPGVVPSGRYIVEVTHKGNLISGMQTFSLVTTSPLSRCQLLTEDRIEVNLPCFDPFAKVNIEINQSEGSGPFEYKIGHGEYTAESTFKDLSPGNYLVQVKDSEECIGIINVSINHPEEIIANLNPESRFHAVAGDEEESFSFSFAFDAGWGGNHVDDLLSARAVFVNDGSQNASLGCNELINEEEIEGNIALIKRGNCEFGLKALHAQNAGASAVIIINNEQGVMTMGAGAVGNQVTIPVYMISASAEEVLVNLQEKGELFFEIGERIRFQTGDCTAPFNSLIDPVVVGGTGEYSFMWNTGDTLSVLLNTGPGEYTLQVKDSNDCEATFAFEIPEIFEPDPIFSITDETCLGENDGMLFITNAQQLGGYNFFLEGMEEGVLFRNLSAGVYFGLLVNNLGCEVITDNIVVLPGAEIPEIEIAGETIVSFDEPVIFSVNIGEWDGSLFWTVINGEIIRGENSGEVEISFDPEEVEATLILTLVKDQCTRTVEWTIMNKPSANSLILPDRSVLSVYPVPAVNTLFVEFESEKLSEKEFIIVSSNGKVINTYTAIPKQEIDISGLSAGLYFLHFEGRTLKFIKL